MRISDWSSDVCSSDLGLVKGGSGYHSVHIMSFRLPFSRRPVHSATSSQLEVKGVRDLDIAEVAKRSGVPASALRYYEEKELIASIGRRGLRRLFDPGVNERMSRCALGRAAGLSLDETNVRAACRE